VLTILIILAGLAVPRVSAVDFTTAAAATEALGGELRTAAAGSHAIWLAEGQPAAVQIEGRSISLIHGYPELDSIDDALKTFEGFAYDSAAGVFLRLQNGNVLSADCAVSYGAPTAKGEAPRILVLTDGC